jgi:hypothetical protein
MDGKETKKSWIEYALDLLAVIMVCLIVNACIALLQTALYCINPDISQINPLEPLPYILVTGFVIYGINLIINNKNKQK